MIQITNSLWVEKYRPLSLDTYIGNEKFKSQIQSFINNADVPHLLLSGKPGTGKTTTARILVNSIPCDVLFINASDENNVDTVRTKIKSFASTFGFAPLKIVVLDEADFTTFSFQSALRNLMETFSNTTRFILTANYIERITDPIISRTQHIELFPPSKKEVAIHLAGILKQEQIEFKVEDVKLLLDTFYPDIRKIIGEAQNHVKNKQLILIKSELIDSDVKQKIVEILSKRPNFNEIRQLLIDNKVRNYTDLYSFLYEKITEVTVNPEHIAQMTICISEGSYRDSFVVDKEITFMATIANILQLLK